MKIEIKILEANGHELHRRHIFFASDKSELRTKQCPIFAASLQPVKPYLVNELLNEGYLGHKRLYYGDTTQLCMLIQLMLIRHEKYITNSQKYDLSQVLTPEFSLRVSCCHQL